MYAAEDEAFHLRSRPEARPVGHQAGARHRLRRAVPAGVDGGGHLVRDFSPTTAAEAGEEGIVMWHFHTWSRWQNDAELRVVDKNSKVISYIYTQKRTCTDCGKLQVRRIEQ